MHPLEGGLEKLECNVSPAQTETELSNILIECDRTLGKDETWIRGSGWSIYGPIGKFVHKSFIDKLKLSRPVALNSTDGHSYWVDSKALKISEINERTPDPSFGKIGRDKDGSPNGILYEDAIDLVEKNIPKRSREKVKKGLVAAIKEIHSNGITSFKDANVDLESVEVYKELEHEGILNVDVELSFYLDDEKDAGQLLRIDEIRKSLSNSKIKLNTVKIYLDGVLEDKNAALISPYIGSKDKGKLNWQIPRLNEVVAEADRLGFIVHFHAIGDAAVRAALDAIEHSRKENKHETLILHEIAHLQVINPVDLKRFGELSAVAVFSPLWAVRDSTITDFAEPLLGVRRSKWLYNIGSVFNNGGSIIFGSDWSVTSMNPFWGINNAVNRTWLPKEKLEIKDAFRFYTRNKKIAEGEEGSFVVVDTDFFKNPKSLSLLKILKTIYKGKLVSSN